MTEGSAPAAILKPVQLREESWQLFPGYCPSLRFRAPWRGHSMHPKQRMVSVSRAPGFEGHGVVTLPGDQRPVLSLPCEAASCQSFQCESRASNLAPLQNWRRWQVGDAEPRLRFERQGVCELCGRAFCPDTLDLPAVGFLCDRGVFFFSSSAAGVPTPQTKRTQAGTRVSQSKIDILIKQEKEKNTDRSGAIA